MTTYLEREGIFKAMPVAWKVKTFQTGKSVSVAIEYRILAQLDGQEWVDWSDYDAVHVWGDHWVVKKDGQPNIATVEQLRDALGWDGNLRRVASAPPPQGVVVQITVGSEDYKGKTQYRVGWLNPGDYVPTGGGIDESEAAALDAQFGSLLRAAAGGAKQQPAAAPKAAPAAAPPQTQRAAPPPAGTRPMPGDPIPASEIPF